MSELHSDVALRRERVALLLVITQEATSGTSPVNKDIARLLVEDLPFRHRFLRTAVQLRVFDRVSRWLRSHVPALDQEFAATLDVFNVTERALFAFYGAAVAGLDGPTRLLKGSALAARRRAASGSSCRPMLDLDILVRPDDIFGLVQRFNALGVVPGRVDVTTGALHKAPSQDFSQAVEYCLRNHYEIPTLVTTHSVPELLELPEWVRVLLTQFGACVNAPHACEWVLAFDVHFNIAQPYQSDDIWSRSETVLCDSRSLDIQHDEDLLWTLGARTYVNGILNQSSAFRLLGDLAEVLNRVGPNCDWDRIAALARKYKLETSLYYVLTHLSRLLPSSCVPAHLLRTWDPATSLRAEDRGDFLPRVLGGRALFNATDLGRLFAH